MLRLTLSDRGSYQPWLWSHPSLLLSSLGSGLLPPTCRPFGAAGSYTHSSFLKVTARIGAMVSVASRLTYNTLPYSALRANSRTATNAIRLGKLHRQSTEIVAVSKPPRMQARDRALSLIQHPPTLPIRDCDSHLLSMIALNVAALDQSQD